MTKELKLNAQARTEKNGKAKAIRENGMIPAVVYGSGIENVNIKMKKLDFERVFIEAGESNLIDLTIDDRLSVKVIIKDVQNDPVRDCIIHVDFYQVDMKTEIETPIPLNFIGESKTVKESGSILIKSLDEINVRCLPGNLVNNIDVDISTLVTLEDVIRIKDLEIPKGIEVLNDSEDMVANTTEQRVEEPESEVEITEEESQGEADKEEGEENNKEDGVSTDEEKNKK